MGAAVVMFVGETFAVVACIQDPLRNNANITDATGTVDFYAPGKTPQTVVEDRVTDKDQLALVYDPAATAKVGSATVLGAYIGEIDTTDWEPGKWTVKVAFTGTVESWEYSSFTLKA